MVLNVLIKNENPIYAAPAVKGLKTVHHNRLLDSFDILFKVTQVILFHFEVIGNGSNLANTRH